MINEKNIDQYIKSFPRPVQSKLSGIRTVISRLAPQAKEAIKYGMPTFVLNGNLIHFAAFKNHIGIYPMPEVIIAFKKELVGYQTSKGAIQLPLDQPLPTKLIEKIVRFRIAEDAKRAQGKISKQSGKRSAK